MRSILKQIKRGEILNVAQEEILLSYGEELRSNSLAAYAIFYEQYGELLYEVQGILIPDLNCGLDDLINYILQNNYIIDLIKKRHLETNLLPLHLQELWQQITCQAESYRFLLDIIQKLEPFDLKELPRARRKNLVIKFEDGNINKEIGLSHHFRRIAKYDFVSRIQSYRYLSATKAKQDRIDYHLPDCLKGIFTNKDKSIMYYIFLSEENELKAKNACQVLNLSLHS